MEIDINDLLVEENINFMNIAGGITIDTNKNFVIFGSNGIGKSTIYRALKNKYKDFDYLDYEETKDSFKKNKKKIELSIGVNKLEELSQKIEQCNDTLSIQTRLKSKGISSKTKAKEVSIELGEKYNARYFENINILEEDFDTLNEVNAYVKYIISNYQDLKAINNIEEELKLVDKNYLRKALKIIEPKISNEINICPVCGSKVCDLKSIIQKKLYSLSEVKNECLKSFMKEFELKLDNNKIKNEFEKILNIVEKIDEKNIIDYFIIDGNKEEKNKINETILNKKSLNKKYEQCLKSQEELFNSLINQKELYTDYLKNNFEAVVNFDEDKKIVTISLDRNVDTFSTGEINVILFISKLFGFLGSEKSLLVIDDPISSYDLVNQYHIVFHLCKIIFSKEKHVLIFTHNPDVINIINSQNNSAYSYMFFDKIDGEIVMNELSENMKRNGKSNVLFIDNLIYDKTKEINKYISLLLVRNDEDSTDYLSSVLHYDGEIVVLDETANEYKGCTNEFLINYIEKDKYITDLNDHSFENLCRTKIMILTSIRVWIEYKLHEISTVPLCVGNNNKGRGITYIINEFFRKNKNIRNNYPNLFKEQLMNKKVMLNQNCHTKSQIQPFYYALSVKVDDIKKEVEELKLIFNTTN